MRSKRTRVISTTDPYMAFLRSLRFKGIGLEESSTKLDRGSLAEATAQKHQLSAILDANYDVALHDKENLIVVCAFHLAQAKTESDPPLVEIKVTFSALFECSPNTPEELPKKFAEREARLVFWPYLRYFVSDMCSRMAINTILLPLTAQFDSTASNEG